ncbi:MAG: tetratricopeptide repeat-containing S1 family peptidase [Prochlorothrix sp.]
MFLQERQNQGNGQGRGGKGWRRVGRSLGRSLLIGVLLGVPVGGCGLVQEGGVLESVAFWRGEAGKRLSPEEVEARARAITVRVIGGESGGSGTIVGRFGSRYTVVTNRHVLRAMQAANAQRLEVEEGRIVVVDDLRVQTEDGEDYAARLAMETPNGEAREFGDRDLVVLEFTAERDYPLSAALLSQEMPEPGAALWAAGFPYLPEPVDPQGLAGVAGPQATVTMGTVAMVPGQALKGGYQLGYSNEIRQGMSGGPILNDRGKVVGFNGRHGNPLFGDPFVFEDGSAPEGADREVMVRLSWGVPLRVLAEGAPDLLERARPRLGGVAEEVYQRAEGFTVRVEGQKPGLQAEQGSGVIVAKRKGLRGTRYFVVTAAHVLREQDRSYSVVTGDGERYRVNRDQFPVFPAYDVALVSFTSQQDYPVAMLATYPLNPADFYPSPPWVFVAGWPQESYASNAALDMTTGRWFDPTRNELEIQATQALENGYGLIYTNYTQGGMSGGPVLDRFGQLLGLHGQAEATGLAGIQTGRSLGVPVGDLVNLLRDWGLEPETWQVATTAPEPLTDDDRSTLALLRFVDTEPPQRSDNAEAWANYGNQLWRVGRNDEAIQAYERAIGLDRGLLGVWYGVGIALRDAERYQESAFAFQQAAALLPESADPWKEATKSLIAGKEFANALVYIDKALQITNQDPTLHLYRAEILSGLKLYPEALSALGVSH